MTTATDHDFDTDSEPHSHIVPMAGFRSGVRAGRYPNIPAEVTAALAAGETLEQMQQQLFQDTPDPGKLLRDLVERLVSGDSPREALDTAVDALFDAERRKHADGLLRTATPMVEAAQRDAISAGLPAILAGLRKELDATIKALRKAYADAGDLDIHQPDPMLVAQATDKQRAALVAVAEGTRAYRLIRLAQRDALTASSLRIPGDNPNRVSWRWADLFEMGLHEVSDPGLLGMPGQGQPKRLAVRAVVERDDVWLPDPEEIGEAYDRLEALRHQPDNPPATETAPAAFGPIQPGVAAYLDAGMRNNAAIDRRSIR